MKKTFVASAIALSLLTSPAFAQAPGSLSDAEFVMKASAGNTFEVDEAKLALERATDPRLKDFAKKMVDDHGDAMKKLQDAADKAGAKAEMMLDKPHQGMIENVKGFNGKDFDKVYTADQVMAHAETVALLSDYIQNGKNDDLKSWAKQALPIVKGHRATINAM